MPAKSVTQALKTLTYGLYVVGARDDTKQNGFTASWVSQISFRPPQILVAVQRGHYTHSLIKYGRKFAVSILREGQKPLAVHFIKPSKGMKDKFGTIPFELTPMTGSPVLKEAMAFLDCKLIKILETGGDHDLIIGEVLDGGLLQEAQPLTEKACGVSYAG